MSEVKEYLMIIDGAENPDGTTCIEADDFESIGSYFKNNMDIGAEWTVRMIKGVSEVTNPEDVAEGYDPEILVKVVEPPASRWRRGWLGI